MKPYPWYFTIDGRPVEVVCEGDVRAMDPGTGSMIPSARAAERLRAGSSDDELHATVVALSKDEFRKQRDAARQPIIERFATAQLSWEFTGDVELPYRTTFDGHELLIRTGDFPAEAMYLLSINGDELYEFDGWPAAWRVA